MTKSSKLRCCNGVSPRLAKLLCKASEDTLMTIYQDIFAELQPRATWPLTRQLIHDCLQSVGKLPRSRIEEAKEPVAIALEEHGEEDALLLREEAILNVCGACTHEESLLGKVDDMLYAIGMFENNERDQILDQVLNHTLGWYSHERGK